MIRASRPRLFVLYLVVAALLFGLATRVWYLQVKTGSKYVAQATSERIRQVVEPSVLGLQVAYAGYFTPLVIDGTSIIKIVKTP